MIDLERAAHSLNLGSIVLVSLLFATASAWVHAQPPSEAAASAPSSADASSPVHANHEHPAVAAWRQAQLHPRPMDPNQMLVQPPASVSWTVLPEANPFAAHRTAGR